MGLGGGFLLVPWLLLYHGFPGALAAGTSLCCVVFNSAVGATIYQRQKRIDRRTGIALGLASLPFALAGALLTAVIPDRPFKLAFGILLGAASLMLLFKRNLPESPSCSGAGEVERRFTDADGRLHHYRYRRGARLAIGAGTGFVSSLTGVGGGVMLVPLMHLYLAMPAHVASGTSHLVVIFTALFGASVHTLLGHASLPHILWISAGILAGAPAGAAASRRLKGRTLLAIVGLVMLYLAGRLVAESLGLFPAA